MAATAGTAIFKGASGKTYAIDLYLSDTVNTEVNWDGGAGAAAGTPTFYTLPENAFLVDLSIITGAAQTRLSLTVNGRATGQMFRHVIQVDTIAQRPALMVGIKAGARVGITQLA